MPYCYPLKGKMTITNKFGVKGNYACGFHTGVDLISDNKNIFSVADGIVTRINDCGTSYGNHIVVEHFDGTTALYAHLEKFYVYIGQVVSCNQNIGYMGNTGNSSGVHLHFELHLGKWSYPTVTDVNKATTLLNPISWLEDRIKQTREISINVNGKDVICEVILYDNLNYIRLRDIEKIFDCKVEYVNNQILVKY